MQIERYNAKCALLQWLYLHYLRYQGSSQRGGDEKRRTMAGETKENDRTMWMVCQMYMW